MRVRSSPAIAEDNIVGLLLRGSDVTWAGEQQVGDGHTWYLVEADGSNRQRIAAVPNAGWVTWSPDGDVLIFEGGVNPWDLYRVDADGGNLTQLTGSLPDMQAVFFKPEFSPNGDEVAVHQLRDGMHLMLMKPNGTGLRKLVDWEIEAEIFDPALIPPPAWSPDGQSIVFLSSGIQGGLDVYVINVDGTGLRNLTDHPAKDTQPAWSLDGRYIAFVSSRDGTDEVYVMNADGSEVRNISKTGVLDECCAAWRP